MIAIRKNRNEKGIRALLAGSKPHSNGEGNSRVKIFFFLMYELINIKTAGTIIVSIIIAIIIYF